MSVTGSMSDRSSSPRWRRVGHGRREGAGGDVERAELVGRRVQGVECRRRRVEVHAIDVGRLRADHDLAREVVQHELLEVAVRSAQVEQVADVCRALQNSLRSAGASRPRSARRSPPALDEEFANASQSAFECTTAGTLNTGSGAGCAPSLAGRSGWVSSTCQSSGAWPASAMVSTWLVVGSWAGWWSGSAEQRRCSGTAR